MAHTGVKPLFDQLIDSKKLEKNLFAFFLTFNPEQDHSELTIGYYDQDRFVPNTLHWHPVTHKVFFAVELVDVRIGSTSLGLCTPDKHCTVTPDSGTSKATVPGWAMQKLQNSGDLRFTGDFACTMDQFMNEEVMVFVLSDGVEYEIPAHHWLERDEFDSTCRSSVGELSINSFENEDMFILGDTFMQLFYTIFDRDNDRVGLAKALHKDTEVLL